MSLVKFHEGLPASKSHRIYMCPSFSIKLMNPDTFFNKETENKSSAYHANLKPSSHKNIKYTRWEQAGKQVDLVTSIFQIKYRSWEEKKKIRAYLHTADDIINHHQPKYYLCKQQTWTAPHQGLWKNNVYYWYSFSIWLYSFDTIDIHLVLGNRNSTKTQETRRALRCTSVGGCGESLCYLGRAVWITQSKIQENPAG